MLIQQRELQATQCCYDYFCPVDRICTGDTEPENIMRHNAVTQNHFMSGTHEEGQRPKLIDTALVDVN